jgi:hypothetical protein
VPAAAPAQWGRRLSDAIREALDAGDLASARRLALDGDGQARSLEKKYALMYRGLGIGRPHWVFDNPSRRDGSCTLHIYKQRDAALPDYVRRLAVPGPPR